ncbi:phosphoenolpyruvate--protein phosphotransferase [Rhizohabitans arisaemae]|uniref:phosphoenolpyruvate--protein phosphotransferase n=1 Tax=Rhizohabitans arisaemae TaxID=2720610 RepID=UPI0024B105D4|nr:phosphoenolpyruvate--protein phosphotransferase [Rhizohabitans arisaemae]
MAEAEYRGLGVSPGIGFAPVYRLADGAPEPPADAVPHGDASAESARALDALERVASWLEGLGERTGGEAGDILLAQALMARDPGLADEVRRRAAEGMAAARAVYEAFMKYRALLDRAGTYLAARVADLDDVRDRVLADLYGVRRPTPPAGGGPYVLIARDLAPADTAALDRDLVAAFVTEEGGPTGHTAIIARLLGIPAVVACPGATSIPPGTAVLVDGSTGAVTPAPAPERVGEALRSAGTRAAALVAARGPGTTADGYPVPLLANIGSPEELALALDHGAEGVGLFRTEFLFLDRADPPSEDEQIAAYRPVLRAFPHGRVVVRVLDAGADKPLAFLPGGRQDNPALGERGLRLLRRHPQVLQTQLKALRRAAEGTLARLDVMAPMVTDAADAAWFAARCRAAGLASAGAVVEVPAAALRARDLAPHLDFVSVGTNDLAQYTFAADRGLGALAGFQDPWHPALLDLVAMTVAAGKPCGVCGEAAADPALACVLVGLGVSSLSLGSSALPLVRAALARHTQQQCAVAALRARAAPTAGSAREAACAELPGLARLGL